jgi:hypothetical protein
MDWVGGPFDTPRRVLNSPSPFWVYKTFDVIDVNGAVMHEVRRWQARAARPHNIPWFSLDLWTDYLTPDI